MLKHCSSPSLYLVPTSIFLPFKNHCKLVANETLQVAGHHSTTQDIFKKLIIKGVKKKKSKHKVKHKIFLIFSYAEFRFYHLGRKQEHSGRGETGIEEQRGWLWAALEDAQTRASWKEMNEENEKCLSKYFHEPVTFAGRDVNDLTDLGLDSGCHSQALL